MKKSISLFLSICMLLSLAACGKDKAGEQDPQQLNVQTVSKEETQETALQSRSDLPTEEGWLMSRVDMPVKMPALVGMDSDGDWLWLSGRCQIDGAYNLVLLGLDTASGQWRQFNLGRAELGVSEEYDLSTASAYKLSVKDGTAWMSVECSSPDHALTATRLVIVDTAAGDVSTVPWETGTLYQSPGQYTIALAALSADRAVLIGSEEACIIDRSASVLSRSSIQADLFSGACKIGGQLYLTSYEGITLFDADSLSLGRSLSLSQGIDDVIMASSQPGNILYTSGSKLYSMNASGQAGLVFDWMDVAMSRDTAAPYYLFENAMGEYYGYASEAKESKLVKVARAQIPVKDTLTMACFFDTQSTNAQTRMTGGMTDAILAYNHSDANYRIEPVYFEYAGSQDLSRALMEAFNSGIDLVDQSNLPEGSISGSQLMDMLPFLDADTELSREDFFPAALQGMSWGGHMYRVSPYFSALGMNVPTGLYPGQEEWSCEFLRQAIANDPSLALGMGKNRTPDYIVKAMAHAITGEFINLADMSCDFQRPEFSAWLGMLSSLVDDTGLAEDRINFTCGVDSYYSMRAFYASEGIYIDAQNMVVGFPDSKGSGFYLASPAAVVAINGEYNGLNTSLSIANGCKDLQAAWDFVKLLLNKAENGVPVLRSAFDEQMDYNARAYSMAQEDIDSLRYIAENAAGTVVADPALIQLISGELNAYASGDQSAGEVADQLQSRVSLYLAEQG